MGSSNTWRVAHTSERRSRTETAEAWGDHLAISPFGLDAKGIQATGMPATGMPTAGMPMAPGTAGGGRGEQTTHRITIDGTAPLGIAHAALRGAVVARRCALIGA